MIDPNSAIEIGDDHPITALVFYLTLTKFIAYIKPEDYGVQAPYINPAEYFITSGDAVEKARFLDKQMWELAGKLRHMVIDAISKEKKCSTTKAQGHYKSGIKLKDQPGLINYEKAIWKNAGGCRKLLQALIKARGTHCFLETEWLDSVLYCVAKDPKALRTT